MLFKSKGQLHYEFLEFIGTTFFYTTGYPVTLISSDNEFTPLHEFHTFATLNERYLLEHLTSKLDTAHMNQVNTLYLEFSDLILYYPIQNKGLFLGTLFVGPMKSVSSSSLVQSDTVQKYLDSLSLIPFSKLQYLINQFNLVAQSTYYDPTVIYSIPINNEEVEMPNTEYILNTISHHNIEQEEKILQKVLLSKKGFKDIAINTISKLSNLVAPPLAQDPVRSEKNRFVVGATIVSRAAIKLGLSSQTAFSHSDYFINKMEDCKTIKEVWNLQITMLQFYRKAVQESREGIYYSDITNLLIEYIGNNIEDNSSLQAICEQLNIDYKYASNRFKKDTGVGFNKFFVNKKLELAKKKLGITEELIQTISDELGFSNSYYFARIFKSKYGISPTEYRKRTMRNID